MKNVATLLLLLVSTLFAAADPPRIAVVRVSDVFKQLESTVESNQALRAKREAINKDKRLLDYQTMYADLQVRGKQLSKGGPQIDPATRQKLEREFALKRQEAMSLLEDFESYREDRNKEINAEMVAGMRERLDLIHSTAEKLAKEEGYDWVFDSSGNSNTGVPLLLYAKRTNDLTSSVLLALGQVDTATHKETAGGKDAADNR
ncbi:OmpH family outer membrane protein [Luteolibacter marinus]|uniref:OmpH family outer membrane protein n=1 Tax=Luteolibacter marinus TaxID=2776705 RepID=UPI001868D542|nr:OmpH family outer membrane protein [Luteolibacter marinus]